MRQDAEVDQLTLGEKLAIDRTALANERTLLAYSRTTIMLAVSAVTLVKVFPGNRYAWFVAAVLLSLALLIAIVGLRRYLHLGKSLREYQRL